MGPPSHTPAPGQVLAGSWHHLLSQGRCRQTEKSGENLPKVIQPFSSCSHELPAHRGCFWRVNLLLRFLPSLSRVLQRRCAPMPAPAQCSPGDRRRPVSGSLSCGMGWPSSRVASCRSGLHCMLGVVVYNPTRGPAGSRGKGLCLPSRATGIAAFSISLICSQSGEEADEMWISPPSHTCLSQARTCCQDAKEYTICKGMCRPGQDRRAVLAAVR